MALIVTPGAADADSYNTLDAIAVYAIAHGLAFATSPSAAGEAAARVGTQWLDGTYRGRFPGYKTNGRSQSLEWPRAQAYDNTDVAIDSEEIPQEILDAHAEASIREYNKPGTLAPDLKRGGAIESVKAASVEVKYAGNAAARTTFTTIDGILSGILSGGSGGGLFGIAVRG